jgi:hypothetical protein
VDPLAAACKTEGGDGNAASSVALCLERSIINMGWPVLNQTLTQSDDLEWFKDAAA